MPDLPIRSTWLIAPLLAACFSGQGEGEDTTSGADASTDDGGTTLEPDSTSTGPFADGDSWKPSTGELPETSTTEASSDESTTASPSDESTTAAVPACGDGTVDEGEACDDADDDSTDGCLADCTVPTSCLDILEHDEAATSGIHVIDSDGQGGYGPYYAHCDMEHAGGGWTLVIVSAEDGHATWTWLNRELMTTDTYLVGNVSVLEEDYKSPGLHLVDFADLLFVHEPSGMWASYDEVGDGTTDVGTFMSLLPSPQCDPASGYAMTDGDLTPIGTNMCDTDLYFHIGDHDGTFGGQLYCEAFTAPSLSATYGPVWNTAGNNGCPFDDPDGGALGPVMLANYDEYDPADFEPVEMDGRGFAYGMGVMAPDDRLEMYVR